MKADSVLPVMERLLVMWQGSHAEMHRLRKVYESLDLSSLPSHEIRWGEIPGRSGNLALQGAAVLG